MIQNDNRPLRARDRQPAGVQDIKNQAQRLHKAMPESTSYNQALELVARSHGFEGWSQLRAYLDDGASPSPVAKSPANSTGPITQEAIRVDHTKLQGCDPYDRQSINRIVDRFGHAIVFAWKDLDTRDFEELVFLSIFSRYSDTEIKPANRTLYFDGPNEIIIERHPSDYNESKKTNRSKVARAVDLWAAKLGGQLGIHIPSDFRSEYDLVCWAFSQSRDALPSRRPVSLSLPWEECDERLPDLLSEMSKHKVFVTLRVAMTEIDGVEDGLLFPDRLQDAVRRIEGESLRRAMNACATWVSCRYCPVPFVMGPDSGNESRIANHKDDLTILQIEDIMSAKIVD
jgi:hypothetical protein